MLFGAGTIMGFMFLLVVPYLQIWIEKIFGRSKTIDLLPYILVLAFMMIYIIFN